MFTLISRTEDSTLLIQGGWGRRRGGGGEEAGRRWRFLPSSTVCVLSLLTSSPASFPLPSPTHLSLLARFHVFCLYPHYTITTTRPDFNITCFAHRGKDEEARHRGVMVHGYRIVTMSLLVRLFIAKSPASFSLVLPSHFFLLANFHV